MQATVLAAHDFCSHIARLMQKERSPVTSISVPTITWEKIGNIIEN
jgi:hypothetical protein